MGNGIWPIVIDLHTIIGNMILPTGIRYCCQDGTVIGPTGPGIERDTKYDFVGGKSPGQVLGLLRKKRVKTPRGGTCKQ